MAARELGLAVETVEGGEGAAAQGRLARLVRRLPVVGRGAPEARSGDPEDMDEPGDGDDPSAA